MKEEPDNDYCSNLLSFTAAIMKKDFVGQKNGEIVGEVVFQSNEVSGILDQIWNVAKPMIVRRVRMGNMLASWDPKETCDQSQLDQFVIVRHISWHKAYSPSALNSSLIEKFKGKKNDIQIFVHIYGNEIDSKAKSQAMQAQLINSKEDSEGTDKEKMVFDWKSWCRFCGSMKEPTKYEVTLDLDYYFQVKSIDLHGF